VIPCERGRTERNYHRENNQRQQDDPERRLAFAGGLLGTAFVIKAHFSDLDLDGVGRVCHGFVTSGALPRYRTLRRGQSRNPAKDAGI